MVRPITLMKMMHCRNIKHDVFKMSTKASSKIKKELETSLMGGVNKAQKIKIEAFNELCRVCLRDGKLSIFRNNATADIANSIYSITGIKISVDDTYPKYICQPCHALLQGAILFRKNALHSDQILRETTNTFKTDNDRNYNNYPEDNKIKISIECKETQKVKSHIKISISEPDIDRDSDVIIENDVLNCLEQEEPKLPKVYEGLSCKRCNLQFNTFEEYSEHRLTDEHENKKEICPICNNLYAHYYMKKHMARHKQEVSYICDVCGRNFVLQSSFNRHRLTHFYNLPFKCSLCPYKGRFSESLKMHMRSHTGERPYQCDECPARFISKSNLSKHMKTHKEQFDFSCEVCGRGFYTKRELEMHIKVAHRGIKDHICKVCNKAFGYRKQMMKHELKVHKREKLRSGRMPLYLQVESMKQHDIINSALET